MIPVMEVLEAVSGHPTFVTFLLHVTIKSSVLLLLVFLATKVFYNLSSAKKHFIWTVTFFIVFLLPILMLLLPSWTVSINKNTIHNVPVESTAFDPMGSNTAVDLPTGTKELPETGNDSVPQNTGGSEGNLSSDEVSSRATSFEYLYSLYSQILSSGKAFIRNNQFISLLQLIWLIGIAVIGLKYFIARLKVYRLYKTSVELSDRKWNTVFRDIKTGFNISRDITLWKNDHIKSPMTWGIIRPKIAIPSEMASWNEERKWYILIHEVAHIKRMDLIVQLVSGFVCMIQWFKPLAWISYKRLSNECEQACDDYVLAHCTNPSAYAKLLLEVAGSPLKWSYPSSAAITMARKHHLEGRLLFILNKKTGRSGVSATSAFAIMFGFFLLAIPLITFSLPEEEGDKVNTSTEASPTVLSEFPQFPLKNDNMILPWNEQLQHTAGIAEAIPETEVILEENNRGRGLPADNKLQQQVEYNNSSTIATLTDILYDEDDDVRMNAVEALGNIGTATAVSSVITSLRRHHWEDLDDVVDIFSSLNNPLPIQILMNSIKDQNREIRREAVFTLNDAPNINAFQPLCDYMEDEDSRIREEAATGLGRIGGQQALQCLINHMNDEDDEVRENVIEAIGRIQNNTAIPALSRALKDEDEEVREEAAKALGAIRDPSAVESLSMALQDESSDVREEAAEALGKIGDQSAIEPLTNALNAETSNDVRSEIMEAIGNIFNALNSGN